MKRARKPGAVLTFSYKIHIREQVCSRNGTSRHDSSRSNAARPQSGSSGLESRKICACGSLHGPRMGKHGPEVHHRSNAVETCASKNPPFFFRVVVPRRVIVRVRLARFRPFDPRSQSPPHVPRVTFPCILAIGATMLQSMRQACEPSDITRTILHNGRVLSANCQSIRYPPSTVPSTDDSDRSCTRAVSR